MKFQKKNALTFLLAVSLAVPAFGMTGCNKTTDEPVKSKPTNVYRAETLMESVHDYSEEATDAGTEYIGVLYRASDSVVVETYSYDADWNMERVFYRFDGATGEKTKLDVHLDTNEDGSWINYMQFTDSGKVWYNLESYTYDETTEEYTDSSRIVCMDADGTALYTADFETLFSGAGDTDVYLQKIVAVGDDAMLVTNSGIYYMDLTETGTVQVSQPIRPENASDFVSVLPLDDSCLIFYYDSEYSAKAVTYTYATGAFSEELPLSDKAKNNFYNAVPSDQYDFVYSDYIGVYGYDIATDTETELLNWVNSDIDASSTSDICIMPDGTIYCVDNTWDATSDTTTILRLTRIPDDEVAEKYMLTIGGTYIDYNLRKKIIAFNKKSEEYRITIRDYSEYDTEDNEWTGGMTQLTNDIVSGNCPDILMVSSDLPYDNFANKGLFVDLLPYLDADTRIDRSDMYDNILNAAMTDGKLYQIFGRFAIQTLVGKSSVVGDTFGWTMADMNKSIETNYGTADGADPFGGEMSRDTFLTRLCTIVRDQFIDKDTGECTFDSAEFIDILKFCATLPETTVYESLDYDEDVSEEFWTEREYIYRNDKAMLMPYYFSGYKYFWTTQMGQFGEEISFVGYPTATGKSSSVVPEFSLAVSTQCKNPDGAWAFISDYLVDECNTETTDDSGSFSIFRSVNAKSAEAALAYHESSGGGYIVYDANDAVIADAEDFTDADAEDFTDADAEDFTDADAEDDENTWYYYLGNEEINIGRMTQAAVDKCNAMIESVDQLSREDSDMLAIIREEASAFFAGQKTAEEVAALIQSRISLYVSEQR